MNSLHHPSSRANCDVIANFNLLLCARILTEINLVSDNIVTRHSYPENDCEIIVYLGVVANV
jgi:hypothetical protein